MFFNLISNRGSLLEAKATLQLAASEMSSGKQKVRY